MTACPDLHLPNGEIQYSEAQVNQKYPIGTVAMFSCNHGSGSRTCESDGNWNSQGATCNIGNKM